MDRVGEGIDQIVADPQHRQEHETRDRGAERRRQPQRFDQPQRQEETEEMGEDGRQIAILHRQRGIFEPLHPALRVGDVHQHRLHLRLLDCVDPARAPGDVDAPPGAVEQSVGDIHAGERQPLILFLQKAGDIVINRQSPQLAAQRIYIGDLALDDLPLQFAPVRIRQEVAGRARQTARCVDHRAPQRAPFPPALIGGIGPEPQEQRQSGAEDGQRQSGRLERQHIVGDRDDAVPHEQQGQRLPHLGGHPMQAGDGVDDHAILQRTGPRQRKRRMKAPLML